ncbi:MAG TPA: hypothetical protein PKL78_15105 [Anaerolineales bacterium]|nr:hypothetical protein [Anaerolineales bacterium]HNO31370.1 hypothetical protein [Anaerolineales bacterium]
MSRLFRSVAFQVAIALLIGLGLGLLYSWRISPVTYVDANPAILRADFKDQYRIAIAASYAATQDLARAQSRLGLLGDPDPIAELSAQAQRMLAQGESFEAVQPLAQLATDLTQGFTSNPIAPTPFPTFSTPVAQFTPTLTDSTQDVAEATETTAPQPTLSFEQTALAPVNLETITPRPTSTPTAGPGAPFALVSQETICDPGQIRGLMQFMLQDSRRKEVPGVEIIVTWNAGEDRFFTGFKPELGDGYADFVMQENVVYNIRIVTGGSFVSNISAPACTDPNGAGYPGGLLLTFQQ